MSDVLFRLAEADHALLKDMIDLLGNKLVVTPDNDERVRSGLRSSDARERQVAQRVSALIAGKVVLEEIVSVENSERHSRAAKARAAEWESLPREVALAAADLVIAAGLVRHETRRVVVVVLQTPMAARIMPAGAALGFHHLAACVGRQRGLDRAKAIAFWAQVESARQRARLPFLGPLKDKDRTRPKSEIPGEFVGFIANGDDDAEF